MRVSFISCSFLLGVLLSGCVEFTKIETLSINDELINTAAEFDGLSERHNRFELRELLEVDPVRTQWCAAFVNAVLNINDIPGSESVSDYPLMARSFLNWGSKVSRAEIQKGDIVVFPRGRNRSLGHVGFYVRTVIMENGYPMWEILGGNQDNTVSYSLYDPVYAIGIRRYINTIAQ